MILWCQLGDQPSQCMKVLNRRKPPEAGDCFEVVPSNRDKEPAISVRCTLVRRVGAQSFYILETAEPPKPAADPKPAEPTLCKVKRITVLLYEGTDKISLYLDAPTPFPEMKYPACANVEARHGYGIEWVKIVFGREPDEIIDARPKGEAP